MKNHNTIVEAATSTFKRYTDKKSISVKHSSATSFQVGLFTALLLSWAAIEVHQTVIDEEPVATTIKTVNFNDNPLDRFIIEQPVVAMSTPVTVIPTADYKIDEKPEVKIDKPLVVVNVPAVPTSNTADPTIKLSSPNGFTKPNNEVSDFSIKTTTLYGVSKAPLFPGCKESLSNEDRKACFSEKIASFLVNRFDTDLAAKNDLSGQIKVMVKFTIFSTGKVGDIEIKAPNKTLEDEARRVINKLPDMLPGNQNGEKVNVIYTLPITLEIR